MSIYYAKNKNNKNLIPIGKSVYGWEFLFKAYPKENLFSFNDWIVFLDERLKEYEIVEDSKVIPFKKFVEIVSTESRKKQFRESSNNEKAELNNHFYERQVEEYKRKREFSESHGVPYLVKLKDIQPDNIWLDADGYSVILGEFK